MRELNLDLYFITDEDNPMGRSLVQQAEAALMGGATVVQLRCKHTPTRLMLEQGQLVKQLCQSRAASFIVNDRVDVAWALQADGVHVGWDDMPYDLVRALLGGGIVVGLSVSTTAEAERAIALRPDYLGVGPIYPTSTKPDAGTAVGPEFIRKVREMTSIPLVAIGGITADKVAEVVAAGADGIAVISAISRASDMQQAAAELFEAVRNAKGTHR